MIFWVNLNVTLPLRHSPLDKSSHGSHTESSVFKQPPPLEPPMSSPPPSLRDPPWPHGGTPPGRPTPGDRPPVQTQRKDSALANAVQGHRIPRPYNKVASSEYRYCHVEIICGLGWLLSLICWSCLLTTKNQCYFSYVNLTIQPHFIQDKAQMLHINNVRYQDYRTSSLLNPFWWKNISFDYSLALLMALCRYCIYISLTVMIQMRRSLCVLREGVWPGQTLRCTGPRQEESLHSPPDMQCKL